MARPRRARRRPARGRGRTLLVGFVLLAVAGCAGGGPGRTHAPYAVRDRTYVPLTDWRGFTEEGLASWYGAEHQGRSTASGERFDARALTAAHPVLPMDTCVRVDNLANGRTVTVRVNDRGPFVPGRVIDLTRAAAETLRLVGPGTARVRLAAVARADGRGSCPGTPA